MLSTVEVAGKRAGDATFLGQPKGLFYLAFTEAWERFLLLRNDGAGRPLHG